MKGKNMKGKLKFDDKWIIVIGACGFIGSRIILELNQMGYSKNIIGADDFHQGIKWKNLVGKNYFEFFSRSSLLEWMASNLDSIGVIFHFGDFSSPLEEDGDVCYRDYQYSIDLLRYVKQSGIRCIYASSVETYGDGSQGFSDHLCNLFSLKPQSLFGLTKHMVDMWNFHNGCFHSAVVGVKIFDTFGHGEEYKGAYASLIYQWVHQLQVEGKISIFDTSIEGEHKSEEIKRDVVSIDFVIKILMDLLFSDVSGILNIGSGEAVSIYHLACLLCHSLNKPVSLIERVSMPKRREQNNYRYNSCADIRKLQSLVKMPSFSLKESILQYAQSLF